MVTTVFGATKSDKQSFSQEAKKKYIKVEPKTLNVLSKTNSTSSSSSKISSSSNKPAFFSKEGQKEALGRVANVLNPFANNPIYFGNTQMDVGAPVRSAVRISEAALLAPKIAAIFGAGSTLATTAANSAQVATISASNYAIPALAGGVGLLAGGLLFGQKGAANAPQSLNQTPQQATTGTQETKPQLFDYSQNQQYADYSIKDSPNASIYGGQTQDKTQSATPFQSFTPQQTTSGNQSQEATTGTNWALIAAIAAGAYILGGR